MDFTLTDEQVLLRDTARALLTRHCPTSLVRAHIDDPAAADPLWEHLRAWVVLGDGPMTDLCLFLEECGGVLAPGPFFATTALALPLARAAGLDVADDLSEGDGAATVAIAGADGNWCANDETTKTFVLEADRVDHVLAINGDGTVSLVRSADVGQRSVGSIDSTRRIFEVDVAGVSAFTEPVDVERWLQGATVALAAEMLGTARWMLATAIDYAKQRVQFDVPIGSFQAIQHKLADCSVDLERARSAVYFAAMCIDADDPERHRAAHVAKAAAGRAATHCAKDGMQIHGGIGYTWEHDLHLYIRRAYASEHLLGTVGWHHDRLADLILG
ncbi:MAG TPA: acyl-CoA dehydrogenase [Acidimicrobiales bacterium]|nr:acyl-CoA dehydrogenase [Acidimicrobiales bacterium]